MSSEYTDTSDENASKQRKITEAIFDSLEGELGSVVEHVDFYLEKLTVQTSNLAELTEFLRSKPMKSKIDQWDLFSYIEVCVNRVDAMSGVYGDKADWSDLWKRFAAIVKKIRGLSLTRDEAGDVTRILFVSAFIIRRLYRFPEIVPRCGVEKAFEFFLSGVPVPIEAGRSLREQCECVAQNLQKAMNILGK